MNTFLPYDSFKKSAECLDRQRLNKQVLECTQVLNIMLVKVGIRQSEKKGWINHPVHNMWTDKNNDKIYIYQLIEYTDTCYKEWIKRGYKNESWIPKKEQMLKEISESNVEFGDKNKKLKWSKPFHEVMKANLIRKDRKHYEKYFGKGIRAKEGYLWENPKN